MYAPFISTAHYLLFINVAKKALSVLKSILKTHLNLDWHSVFAFFFFLAGLIGQLNPDAFLLLMKLQNKMASVVKTVGNIEHEVYPLTVGWLADCVCVCVCV